MSAQLGKGIDLVLEKVDDLTGSLVILVSLSLSSCSSPSNSANGRFAINYEILYESEKTLQFIYYLFYLLSLA